MNPLTLFINSKPVYQRIAGGRIHYCDQGQGDVVIMLHGNPTWSYLYRHLLVTLRNSYRVIAYDHLGCGFSARPADSYEWTLARRIADFEQVLEVLNVHSKMTLIMHDWGVAIGCGYAVRYPEHIARLVICNGAAFPLPSTNKNIPWQLRPFRQQVLGRLLVQDMNFFLHAVLLTCTQKKITPAVKSAYLSPYRQRSDRQALWQFVADIPVTADDRSYSTITAIANNLPRLSSLPMLLCWGKRDFIFDKSFLRQWCVYFPQAQLREYEHCGHLLWEDDPYRISRDVRDFLG